MKKRTYKKQKKPFRPPPKDPVVSLNAGPMTDEALLDRYRGGKEQPGPEAGSVTRGGLIRERLREHWVWMFETEIHSRSEATERISFIILPAAVLLIFSQVVIPKLFAFLFG